MAGHLTWLAAQKWLIWKVRKSRHKKPVFIILVGLKQRQANSFFSRIRVKETHFFVRSVRRRFFPIYGNNLLCVIHRSRNFYLFLYFCLYGKFSL